MKWFVILNILIIIGVLFTTQYVFSSEMPAKPIEMNSPADRVKEEQIKAFEDKVEVNFERKIRFVKFIDTNSMDPVLDSETNAIEMLPESPGEIKKGDIISYKTKRSSYPVIHRVVDIGADDNGWYALAKGDNNPEIDPEKIRFNEVNGVVVALFY